MQDENYRDQLKEEVLFLQTTINRVKDDLLDRMEEVNPENVFTVRYPDGRYVLLDAQTALVSALTALVDAEPVWDVAEAHRPNFSLSYCMTCDGAITKTGDAPWRHAELKDHAPKPPTVMFDPNEPMLLKDAMEKTAAEQKWPLLQPGCNHMMPHTLNDDGSMSCPPNCPTLKDD